MDELIILCSYGSINDENCPVDLALIAFKRVKNGNQFDLKAADRNLTGFLGEILRRGAKDAFHLHTLGKKLGCRYPLMPKSFSDFQ